MMHLKIKIKEVYGREMIYPACEKTLIFAEMLQQKTFTKRDVSFMKCLGYTFETVQKEKKGL